MEEVNYHPTSWGVFSESRIKALIEESGIPDRLYNAEEYNCMHFSFDVIRFLRNKGIPASFAIVYRCIWELNHALVAIPFNKSNKSCFVLFDVAGGTPIECYTIQEVMRRWNKLLIFTPAVYDEHTLESIGEDNIAYEYPPESETLFISMYRGLRWIFFTLLCIGRRLKNET